MACRHPYLRDQQVATVVLGGVDGVGGGPIVGGHVAVLPAHESVGGGAVVHRLLELGAHQGGAGHDALEVDQLGQELQGRAGQAGRERRKGEESGDELG